MSSRKPFRWEILQEWLYERFAEEGLNEETGVYRFVNAQLPLDDPSAYIQSYLSAQKYKKTMFVIHRVPGTRTTRAVWEVGTRAAQARSVGAQVASDMRRKVELGAIPTLGAIAHKNPRAAKTTDALSNVIASVVELLEAA